MRTDDRADRAVAGFMTKAPAATQCTTAQDDAECPGVRIFSVTAVRLAMKYSEFKRWLAAQGARFRPGNGSHLHVELNGRHSVFPFHGSKEIPNPLVKAIKKDLDLD